MASPIGSALRAASLALVCACISGCPDAANDGGAGEGDGNHGGSSAGAGMSGADSAAGAGATTGSQPTCAAPAGTFDATFEALDGTCGALPRHSLRFDGASILIQKLAELDIESEIIVEGCTVSITQVTRNKQGTRVKQMEGQGLGIQDDGTIVGVVTWTLYDDLGQATCSGDYQATLTPNGQALGGASGMADSGGSSGGGGAGGGATDEPSFSEQHAAEIQKDCNETVNCFLQRDEQLEENPFVECVADSSAALDGDERRQAAFLATFERCKALVVCDYYDCATSSATGYGASQAPAVRVKCDAESACRAESGTPDADPAFAVATCVAVVTGELDAYTQSQRTTWEAALRTCSTLTSCDYVSCLAMR